MNALRQVWLPMFLALVLSGSAGCASCQCAPSEASPSLCANGQDDDGDLLIDCADPDCSGIGSCAGGVCGNGIVEEDEACDGLDLGGESCASLGFTVGPLGCSSSCEHDVSECSTCGDNLASGIEECDGADLRGETCASLGWSGMGLSCAATCAFDPTGCSVCGNGVVETGELCDGGPGGDEFCAPDCTLACQPSVWGRHPANPVFDVGGAGSWDSEGVMPGHVLLEGGTYRMWYSGFDGTTWRIGLATSPDGLSWTREGMVLDTDVTGDPKSSGVRDPTVRLEGSTYRMWFTANYWWDDWRVLTATSPDGVTWEDVEIVIEPSATSSDFDALHPHMIVVEGMDALYYTYLYADRLNIRSDWNGAGWAGLEIGQPNPVQDPPTWDSDAVTHPWVVELPIGGYQMWYVGNDGSNDRIGAAFEEYGGTMGRDFLRQGIVLDLGTPGAWDDTHVSSPTVMLGEAPWRMWYAGSDGTTWRVGLAEGVCAP